ncbi:MAG: GlsB/YeaQ/YmgE family stress response membrane protein [Thermomicrobiales bacterium]
MDVNSSFGIISWIVFGALAGWVASMISGDNGRQGWLGNIIVGIVGAFIGGIIFGFLFGGGQFMLGWNFGSFIAAVIGAIILLAILRMFGAR